MKRLKKLNSWDFVDRHQEPDGYDMKTVIEGSGRNFRILIKEHNKLVELVNRLAENTGIITRESE